MKKKVTAAEWIARREADPDFVARRAKGALPSGEWRKLRSSRN